ncbi:MAG TPA: ribulose-phosphate 3-epimerase [Candidatus Aminicenantes bacterium]|nr:ribulose-phosphate 3-epimerase [Candidatus Aminicenantes bacterium]HRY66289.1 ribulose-phosphate 3-epimerase [Candidatus Aminicenantes bacterium]HRZ73191.1 ribulose-phosphate 3-epimerase [Candidatus Aminicenantes bacterium]
MALIAPSLLSADFSRIGEAVRLAEEAGADLIHVDIMDGHFVPNLTLGPQLVAAVRKETRLPIDVHLMVENPRAFVPLFHEAGADWISLHVEATAHLHKDLSLIRSLGRRAGAALNPATPIGALEEVLGQLDYVLIMSVNPGWGGQSFIPSCRDKIRRLRDRIRAAGLTVPIEVDGGVKLDNAGDIIRDGCGIVVAGSAVYDAPDPAAAIRTLKDIARKAI